MEFTYAAWRDRDLSSSAQSSPRHGGSSKRITYRAFTFKHQVRVACRRIGEQNRDNFKRGSQMIRREYVHRIAVGEDAAMVEQQKAIREAGRQPQIVHDAHHDDIRL